MVHTSKTNNSIKILRCGNGLYYYSTVVEHKTKKSVLGYSRLSTVDVNKDYFTRRKIEGADDARIFQGRIFWLSNQD